MKHNMTHQLADGTSEIHVAWAAGLFEREGSIISKKPGSSVRLQLNMTDEDCIQMLYDVCGGHIYGPYNTADRPHAQSDGRERKPYWVWCTHGTPHAMWVLNTLYPYLHGRRKARALEAGLVPKPFYPFGYPHL
jgi:hypothetical protein